jgi:hypothetical protein
MSLPDPKTTFDRDGLSALSAVPKVCKDDQGAARSYGIVPGVARAAVCPSRRNR